MMKNQNRFLVTLLVFSISCSGANNLSEETTASQSATKEGAPVPLSQSPMSTSAQLRSGQLDAGISDVSDTDAVTGNEKTTDVSDSVSDTAAPIEKAAVSAEQTYHIPTTNLLRDDKHLSQIGAVYPIGWSKDGMFSYVAISIQKTEGSNYDFEFIIQNMKSDAVVYRLDNENYEVDMPEKILYRLDELKKTEIAEAVWTFYKNRIVTALSNRGIIQNDEFRLMSFPITTANDVIDIELIIRELCRRTDDKLIDYDLYNIPTTIQIKMHSKKQGEKQVYFKKYPVTEFKKVLGYIKSPFEDRVAILVGMPTNDHNESGGYFFDFVGAHISKGFHATAKSSIIVSEEKSAP